METLKCIRQRIEILSCSNSIFGQLIKYFCTACTKQSFLKNYREIRIIALYIILNTIKLNAIHSAQMLTVSFHYSFTFCNLIINMAEITNSHCCTEFIHFCICTDCRNFFRAMDAKILQLIQFLSKLFIFEANCPSLNTIKDLRCMEAKA